MVMGHGVHVYVCVSMYLVNLSQICSINFFHKKTTTKKQG